ncbi:MAG: hydrogenase expression protein HypE [Acidobacteriota bacterium]|nr:hydrogenase expression protein HypE [Acidobacteriota bacterium]
MTDIPTGKVAGGPGVEFDDSVNPGAPPLGKIYAFWLAGMSCDGCSIAVTGATEPAVEDLLLARIPGLPRLILYHPVLSIEPGAEFVKNFELAAEGKLDAPYVVILEGSAVDDSLIQGDGYWVGLGARHSHEDGRKVISVMEWIDRLAPGAAAMIAIGTCATWGGIPAAVGNPTGAMGMMDYLGKDYRSAFGLPVINIPGCSPVGDNFTEVVAMVLHFLQGTGPLPEFDELGRPAWQFRDTVHNRCVRGGYYEEGIFAKKYGDAECLVEIGCWGPVVQCNIAERGAIRHYGGCMNQGGICIGCTMPGFPDKFSPFYKRPPGSAVSTAIATTSGTAMRFLRSFTRDSLNRESMWHSKGEIPSGWAAERRPEPLIERFVHYFYRMRQFSNSKAPGRNTPETKFRDGFEVEPVKRNQAEGADPRYAEKEKVLPYERRAGKRAKEATDRREKGAIAPNLE